MTYTPLNDVMQCALSDTQQLEAVAQAYGSAPFFINEGAFLSDLYERISFKKKRQKRLLLWWKILLRQPKKRFFQRAEH